MLIKENRVPYLLFESVIRPNRKSIQSDDTAPTIRSGTSKK